LIILFRKLHQQIKHEVESEEAVLKRNKDHEIMELKKSYQADMSEEEKKIR
jgi:hypothetical protein